MSNNNLRSEAVTGEKKLHRSSTQLSERLASLGIMEREGGGIN